MTYIHEYDGIARKLEKENEKLRDCKEHMEKAYKELQVERDALHEANDILEMLVEKAFKEGYWLATGAKKIPLTATKKWLSSNSRVLLKGE